MNTSVPEHGELHAGPQESMHNWLRAAVLGANDGIVSVAALVVGVAGANSDPKVILTAGIAGTLAGAFSMSAGEYVSVQAQRDSQEALLKKEKWELENEAEKELEELTVLYRQKGLSRPTAETVAKELTAHDALAAHADIELRIDPEDLSNPWHAATASWFAFLAGAILPLLAITLPPQDMRVPATFAAVIIALAITGFLGAHAGEAHRTRAAARVAFGGALAMAVTYAIGLMFGVALS